MTPEKWEKIKDLFEIAQEISADERTKFLDKECGDDFELRREIEKLLNTYREDETFLENSAIAEAVSMFEDAQTRGINQKTKFTEGTVIDEHYRILGLLGRGGMGEVYLAHDLELQRKVALKILPADFANDSLRMKRFVQEARSVSALNHPNILTIYEIGETEGIHFIATEYIEGKTLKKHLRSKTLSLKSALDIVIQITLALSAAHEAGIIHRDIKPDNVMIRTDGIVKILDFGLAKTTVPNIGADTVEYPSVSENAMTLPGMILGTPQYMSPEQACGRKVDSRSDIFSLGVLFYEMITSHPPFVGESSMDVLGSILKDDPPPIGRYIENAPNELGRTIYKTLNKDPKKRYQNTRDLLTDLKELREELTYEAKQSFHTDETIVKTTVQNSAFLAYPRRISYIQVAIILAFVTVTAFSLWLYFSNQRKNEINASLESPFKTVEITNWSSAPGELFSSAAFSPDGRMVAFDSTKSGTQSIWVKQTNSGEPVQVTKDEFDNKYPVWSPNGEELAFFSIRGDVGGIWRIPALGGSPKLLAQLKDFGSELKHWSKSGKVYYQSRRNLYSADESSGQTTQITNFDPKMQVDILDISPDETQVAYLIEEENVWNIKVKPVVGETVNTILTTPNEINSVVWHPDGKRVLYSVLMNGIFQIFETDFENNTSTQLSFAEKDSHIKDITSDGTRILFGSATENSDLWRVNVSNGEESVVSSDITSELWADISPDNKIVAFQSIKNLSQGNKLFEGSIVMKSLSGNEQATQVVENGFLPVWSPDGKTLAFLKLVGQGVEIWKIDRSGSDLKRLSADGVEIINLTVSPYNRHETKDVSWSPQNDVLAYSAVRDGISNIWLVTADGSSDRSITDNDDKNLQINCPIWSSDGRKLAFTARTLKRNSEGERTYQFWLYDLQAKEKQKVFETKETIRLLGWSENEEDLILAESNKLLDALLPEVLVYNVSIKSGERRLINTLKDTYYFNIHLSPDGKEIGFVSRSTKNDEVWITSADGGQPRKLTKNNDPRVYFSTLSWSPDSKFILFGKQSRFSLLSMIVNLKLTEQKNEEKDN